MMPPVRGAASSRRTARQSSRGMVSRRWAAGGGDVAAGRARGYRDTVVAAACLGLVWLGDALIYVVLPLYPAAFGVEIAAVAILLSVNRVIRIVGYGWVSPLARRFGANTLTAAACAAGALSTLVLRAAHRLRAAVRRAAGLGRRLRRDQPDQHGLCVWRRPTRRHAHRAQSRGEHARAGAGARARRLARDARRAAACLRHLRPGRPRGGAARAHACRACARRSAKRRPRRTGAGRRARSTCCSSSSRSAPTACSPRRSRPCSPTSSR